MASKITGRRVRPIRPQFLPPQNRTLRRREDGSEVCLNNSAGRAEYSSRKEQVWAEQKGICALESCHRYVPLLLARLTSGSWQETNQLRNDIITESVRMVHKDCLRAWHRQHAREHDNEQIAKTKETPGQCAHVG